MLKIPKIKRGYLRCDILVKGNLKYLAEYMRQKSIGLYKIKEGKNSSVVTIDYADKHKFFAICKNMCYNYSVYGFKGVLSPVAYTLSRIGLIIGAIFFIIMVKLSNDYIFYIEYKGSGSAIKNSIEDYLISENVRVGSNFNDINFEELSTNILKSNQNLIFVNCYKSGSRLIVNSVLGKGNDKLEEKVKTPLVSQVDGVVEWVNVLRGTANVKVGDSVKSGDLLILPKIVLKDGEEYDTFVLGSVSVIYEKQEFFATELKGEEVVKNAIASIKFKENDEVLTAYGEEVEGGVLVKITLRHIHNGG